MATKDSTIRIARLLQKGADAAQISKRLNVDIRKVREVIYRLTHSLDLHHIASLPLTTEQAPASQQKWRTSERERILQTISNYAREETMSEQTLLEKLAKGANETMIAELLGLGGDDGKAVNSITVQLLAGILAERGIEIHFTPFDVAN